MGLPRWYLGFGLAATLIAAVAPLFAYTVSLALFGLQHVVVELGYVRERFRGPLLAWLAAPLLAICALRLVGWAGHGGPWSGPAELALGLVAVAVVARGLHSPRARAAATLLGGALAVGIVASPLVALVLFSVLHNGTPLGFFADRWAGRPGAGRAMAGAVALFVGLPLLVASGAARWGLAALAGGLAPLPDPDVLGAGPLAAHLGVYVLPAFVGGPGAADLFAGVVVAQLLHYGAVIGVLGGWRGPATTPARRAEASAALLAGVALFVLFTRDFAGTRALYGSVAAIHAWIELPLLLVALDRGAPALAPTAGATT